MTESTIVGKYESIAASKLVKMTGTVPGQGFTIGHQEGSTPAFILPTSPSSPETKWTLAGKQFEIKNRDFQRCALPAICSRQNPKTPWTTPFIPDTFDLSDWMLDRFRRQAESKLELLTLRADRR